MYLTVIGSALTLTACSWILSLTMPRQPRHNMTVGQIMSASFQIVLLSWGITNMLMNNLSSILLDVFIGYLMYDTIDLIVKPIGKNVTELYVHHILSIFLIMIIKYFTDYNILYAYAVLLALEASSLMLNITNLTKQFFPDFRHINTINLYVYFLSRIVVYPVLIIFYYQDLVARHALTYISGFTVILLSLGGILFIWWFMKLYEKTRVL